MAKTYQGHSLLVGDGGNPSGTGIAILKVYGLPTSDDEATVSTRMATFAAALKTGGFTGCNVGDTGLDSTTINFQEKPGADINVDRQMICTWRQKTLADIHHLTISGFPEGSALATLVDKGERITEAAKATLAGYINTLFGLTDDVVVLTGVVKQKK